jgi:membrane-associated phospholipid phosphatase
MNANTFLFQLVHQGAGHWPLLDRFFIILTSYVSYAVIAIVFAYVFFVLPFRAKDPLKRLHRMGQATELFVSLFFVQSVVWALKVLVAHPRPFIALEDVTPLVSVAPFESFPSFHAAGTMALAIAVLPYHRHLGHLLIAFSLVVALSRLYVGVHYPFDIAAGLLIGFVIPKLIHHAFKK